LFIFSSCIFGFLGPRIVFFWICFIYVFKIGDWPSIDEHRTPLLFSSGYEPGEFYIVCQLLDQSNASNKHHKDICNPHKNSAPEASTNIDHVESINNPSKTKKNRHYINYTMTDTTILKTILIMSVKLADELNYPEWASDYIYNI
jgi:hypothetical protein